MDVAEPVEGMAGLVASTAGPQVRVAVSAAPDLPPALADANQFEVAILNVAVNVRDAMPDEGTLRISALDEDVDPGHPSGAAPGRYLRLLAADTGLGMDEATRARAVEPFFSTKGIGRGTGLGLSMAQGLAAQLGGALTIASRPGLGTNVELWLPAVSEVPPDAVAAEAAPKSAPESASEGASPARGTAARPSSASHGRDEPEQARGGPSEDLAAGLVASGLVAWPPCAPSRRRTSAPKYRHRGRGRGGRANRGRRDHARSPRHRRTRLDPPGWEGGQAGQSRGFLLARILGGWATTAATSSRLGPRRGRARGSWWPPSTRP